MDARPPLSGLTADQLRVRAAEFRGMATTATTAETRDALLRLVVRLERLAIRREHEEGVT